MEQDRMIIWALLVVSLVGFIVVGWFITKPQPPGPVDAKMPVWAAFASICVLGAVATLIPHRCHPSKSLPLSLDPKRFTRVMGFKLVHGHHPACGKFSDHELLIGGKTFCAGCVGLFVGALASLSVATMHFLHNYRLPIVSGYFGLGFVLLGLLAIPLTKKRTPLLRSGLNAILVLGFSLVLVTVDLFGDMGFDFFVIGMCTYWMYVRIQLSRWSHDEVCGGCEDECEKKAG